MKGDEATAAGVDLADLPRETMGPAEPTVTPVGDDLVLHWPNHKVAITFSRLHEGRDGITSELLVASDIHGEIHWGRLNLVSTPARAGLVKTLERGAPVAPWGLLLERACRQAALHLRAGAPVICLMPRRAPATRHLITKLVLAGETNVLFGDGGSGKSLLALGLAIAASTGTPLPAGLSPAGPVRALYLDYESCVEEHEDRLAGLLAGLGIREAPPILYRQMVRPLAEDAAFLRAEISQHQIGFVIVDSLAPACGAEPEGADAAVRTFTALRSFGAVSRLVVAHVSKAGADQRTGPARPFGSVFVQNLARNVWEVRKAEDDGEDALVLGLYHRKFNSGRRLPPFGLRIDVDDEATTLHGHDVGQQPDLLARTPLTYQIKKALTTGARSIPELVEETQGAKGSISRTLRRWRGKGLVIQVDPDRWGLKV